MNQEIKTKIEEMINNNRVFLFMKGDKNMPVCGFSKQVVEILNSLNVEFESFNVFSDQEIRTSVKEYSAWPTYPQLYFKGQLIGGCDIITEMFESGELEELLKND